MKLVLLCYLVKFLSGYTCLAIRKIWYDVNSQIFLNDNSFWLSDCMYLLTSKPHPIELPYLASLLSLIQN